MGNATSAYTVELRRERAPTPEAVGRVPRVVRLLALAHRIEEMIRAGEIPDYVTAARLCGVTRGRMTQMMNLLLLAPEIQEAILDLPPVVTGRDPITERYLRAVVVEPLWERPLELWRGSSHACRDQGKDEECPS